MTWVNGKDYDYRELSDSIEVRFTTPNTLFGRVYPSQEKTLIIKYGQSWLIKNSEPTNPTMEV